MAPAVPVVEMAVEMYKRLRKVSPPEKVLPPLEKQFGVFIWGPVITTASVLVPSLMRPAKVPLLLGGFTLSVALDAPLLVMRSPATLVPAKSLKAALNPLRSNVPVPVMESVPLVVKVVALPFFTMPALMAVVPV